MTEENNNSGESGSSSGNLGDSLLKALLEVLAPLSKEVDMVKTVTVSCPPITEPVEV